MRILYGYLSQSVARTCNVYVDYIILKTNNEIVGSKPKVVIIIFHFYYLLFSLLYVF